MATSEAKEIKKQETLVRFSIISYKTNLIACSFSPTEFGDSEKRTERKIDNL